MQQYCKGKYSVTFRLTKTSSRTISLMLSHCFSWFILFALCLHVKLSTYLPIYLFVYHLFNLFYILLCHMKYLWLWGYLCTYPHYYTETTCINLIWFRILALKVRALFVSFISYNKTFRLICQTLSTYQLSGEYEG